MAVRNGDGGRSARDADDVPPERRGGAPQRVGVELRRMLEEMFRRPRAERALEVVAAWSRAVGPRAAQAARPLRLLDGRLVVQVTSPTWRSELQFRAGEILRRLRRELGDAVRTIEFRVGVNPDLRPDAAPASGTARPAYPGLRAVAESLEMPELRELAMALAEGRGPAQRPRPAGREASATRRRSVRKR